MKKDGGKTFDDKRMTIKKEDKRALSNVVGILLLILITIIALVIIWFSVSRIINKGIHTSESCSQGNLDKVKLNSEFTCFTFTKNILGKKKCAVMDILKCDYNIPGLDPNNRFLDVSNVKRECYLADPAKVDDEYCRYKCDEDSDCKVTNPNPNYIYKCYDPDKDPVNTPDDKFCVWGGNFLLFSIDIRDVSVDNVKFTMEGEGNTKALEFSDNGVPCLLNEGCHLSVMGNFAKCWDKSEKWWYIFGGSFKNIILKKNEGHTYYTGMQILPVLNEKPEVIKLNPTIDGELCDVSDEIDDIPDCIDGFPQSEPPADPNNPPNEIDCNNGNFYQPGTP